ncbi:MAG: hypothetical protein DI586_08705 [Micavibrio aeruginosavorus]|uniref:Uncharacterized protein n=1 Tax=Micavibrio aeruginosavorus TaxID=349221 RepID=A0A2W5FLZ3_9BACT|nr:MAG: hypothetical protein DI586_08705 [Micavibrio aeruginosavorus]
MKLLNKFKFISFKVIIITIFLILSFDVQADSNVPNTGGTFDKSEQYKGQRNISCGEEKVEIPEFFPISRENLFIRYSKANCSSENFEMVMGIGKNCAGEQICFTHSFSKQKLADRYINSALDEIFSQGLKARKLNEEKTGYLMPVKVYAYPGPLRIIWIDRNYIYMIGQKGGDESTLIKSANSLINKN